jgi:hypothetical protein
VTATVMERGMAMLREFAARFSARRNEGPIDTVDKLCDFAATRAAFVSQKKLYGYLKTRMGTRYQSMFEDDLFIESVNIAKMHVFAASLSDLTVFCVAKASLGHLEIGETEAFARRCFRAGIEANASHARDAADIEGWHADFERRLQGVHWGSAGASGEVFDESQAALLRWAPIAPELKRFDGEIVRNSIRFAWNEVRIDFRTRLEAESVSRDWRDTGGA